MKMPQHGGQLRALARQCDCAPENLLDFSANINPDGPPGAVRTALRDAIEGTAALTLYPDLDESVLREAIGDSLGLPAEAIFVGNGFVPLLRAVVETLAVRRCLLPVPCFNEYRRTLELAGVGVVPFKLQAFEGFAFDPAAILEAARISGCDCLLIANPQNPSGVLCPRTSLDRLIERAAASGIRVLLDEAFIDYAPEESITSQAAQTTSTANLVVFRSVTKFLALPGLRVAYGVGEAILAGRVQRSIAPWAITTLASMGVIAALGDRVFANEARVRNEKRRNRLAAGLSALGLEVFAGRANFLLVKVPEHFDPQNLLWQRMIVEHRIVLRDCSRYEGLGQGFYRVAVRRELDNQRLLDALQQTL